MESASSASGDKKNLDRKFLKGLARAFAGAILFSFPILMTMEMWYLGFYIDRWRLALFMFLAIPLLVGLSHYIGFEETFEIFNDLIDAFVAYAIGFVTSGVMLLLFGVIEFGMSADEIIGKVALQGVVAAIGAMFAQSQLGGQNGSDEENNNKHEKNDKNQSKQNQSGGSEKDEDRANGDQESENQKRMHHAGYFGELFLMMVGAIFLAMNPAATEEMALIAYKMSNLQIVLLMVLSLVVMHAFVYSVGFRGQEKYADSSFFNVFTRFTMVGYAIALLVSLYLLWTFGLVEETGFEETMRVAVVLGFPAALGAAASRLIL